MGRNKETVEKMEKRMRWIAIAATVENEVVAAHEEIVLLEEAAEEDFDVVVKIYGVTDDEHAALKSRSWNWRIRFNNLRSTYLEPVERSERARTLSEIYSKRLEMMSGLRGRFEHALNRHRPLLSQQLTIYEAKCAEAKHILTFSDSDHRDDGFIKDYADEVGIDVDAAAQLVALKHDGWYQHLRNIERLRIRHFSAIKRARTLEEFKDAEKAIDKDFFINMLL